MNQAPLEIQNNINEYFTSSYIFTSNLKCTLIRPDNQIQIDSKFLSSSISHIQTKWKDQFERFKSCYQTREILYKWTQFLKLYQWKQRTQWIQENRTSANKLCLKSRNTNYHLMKMNIRQFMISHIDLGMKVLSEVKKLQQFNVLLNTWYHNYLPILNQNKLTLDQLAQMNDLKRDTAKKLWNTILDNQYLYNPVSIWEGQKPLSELKNIF